VPLGNASPTGIFWYATGRGKWGAASLRVKEDGMIVETHTEQPERVLLGRGSFSGFVRA